MNLKLTNRQSDILSKMNNEGRVDVDLLASIYCVTTQTIRRDLNEICQKGFASRIHGGAIPAISVSNVDYERRRGIANIEKTQIARTTAGLIPNNCSVILNIGTTTEHVAHSLFRHSGLVVISNNINVIRALSGSIQKQLILVGGAVRQSDGAIIGGEAVEFIGKYKADYACIGASAIDEDGSILDHDSREVAVAHAILSNARTKILVCDSLKFKARAPVRICDIGELDYLITDAEVPRCFKEIAEKKGTSIIYSREEKLHKHQNEQKNYLV